MGDSNENAEKGIETNIRSSQEKEEVTELKLGKQIKKTATTDAWQSTLTLADQQAHRTEKFRNLTIWPYSPFAIA